MTSYKDLGLVNTSAMFNKAFEGGFAVPAYNFNNMEQLQAIVTACAESDACRGKSCAAGLEAAAIVENCKPGQPKWRAGRGIEDNDDTFHHRSAALICRPSDGVGR